MFKLFSVFLVAWVVFGQDKLSLQERTQKLQKNAEISRVFKASLDLVKDPESELAPLWKLYGPQMEVLRQDFAGSRSFVRGEIENEQVLSGLIAALQLSLIRVRSLSFQGQWPQVEKEFAAWFLFAADFPYEESSLVGLRAAGVIRSLLLDELEGLQRKFGPQMAQNSSFGRWFQGVRAPWPLDRILISESKRLLKPEMMVVAEAAAQAYQLNPYQTIERSLQKVKGGQSEAALVLKKMWRSEDIQLMKTEVNRIGKMKVRLAKAEFEYQHKRPPRGIEELVQVHLLGQIPIDYFSGKPLDLTSL